MIMKELDAFARDGNLEVASDRHNVSTEYSPVWLKNSFEDDVWYLREFLSGEHGGRMTVTWMPARAEVDQVGRWNYWKNYGKRVAYWAMESDSIACNKASSLAVLAREIRSLCEWLCFHRKCLDIQSVTQSDVASYERYVESLGLAENSVMSKLYLLSYFWELSDVVGEGLSFAPYFGQGDLKKIAKRIGTPNGRTPTLYPMEFFEVLNAALECMGRSSEIIGLLETYLECSEGKCRSFRFKRATGVPASVFIAEARELYGACLVVLFSLLGLRKHELAGITYRNVCDLLESDSTEIEGVVHKTSGTLTGRITKRASIDEVKVAFRVVGLLTDATRKSVTTNAFFLRLPLKHSASKNPCYELTPNALYRLLDGFASSAGVNRKLRPHMFRRAFSLLWSWRFEVGDLSQLSKLLYHNNEAFTKFYTEDEDVWQFLPDAEQSITFEILEKAMLGNINIVGGFGATIRRYQRLLTAKVEMVTPERVESFVRKLVDRFDYTVIPNNDGYCFINAARGHQAKCSTDGKNANYANRDETKCACCPNFGVDDSRMGYWESRKKHHSAVLNSSSIDKLVKASQQGVERAEKVLSALRGGYE